MPMIDMKNTTLKVTNETYRIVGPYISRIAIKFIFAESNFVDCMIKATPTQVLLAGCEVYDLDTASTRACGLGS